MDIRPCPRCRKVLPTDASFCRRCGVAVGEPPPWLRPGPRSHAGVAREKQAARLGSRWASTVATTATAALGVVLALFAASGPRVAVRHGEPGPHPAFIASETYAAPAAERVPPLRPADAPFAGARKQSPPSRRAPSPTPIEAFALRNPSRPKGPEIIALSSPAAGREDRITVRGSRLSGARQVLFIGAERGRAEARFVVWDDEHLIVAVPDLGHRRQAATIAVLTRDGVAVSVSPGTATTDGGFARGFATPPSSPLCLVRPGTVLDDASPPAAFVEDNAAARAAAGTTLFVRRGGRLWGHGGGDCLVFCERGVVLRSDAAACDFVEVDFVNPCVVGSAFHYTGH